MSQELIYTSSPKGLKLGARGFCTVASTPGMAKNLADRLESLSGYRHLYPPGSPEAHLNPVNFSYLRFVLGGQTYYLLSRIADAGLDYTQRTNKLAHHIALQQTELPSAGPAWLASQPDVFETTWNRDPTLLPTSRRQIPQAAMNADVCSAWKIATGDAGWAGVLAKHVLSHGSSEAYLIYRPGTDVLELFTEAQSLLSPEQRWEATFSTYFTNLPPGFECRWRGVVDGSPEALRARRSPGLLVIDLLAALGRAAEDDFVERARSGNVLSTTKTQTLELSVIGRRDQSQPQRLVHATSGSLADTAANLTEAFPSKAPPKLPSKQRAYAAAHIQDAQRGRRWLKIATCLLMAMLGGAGICALLLYASGALEIAKPTVAQPSDEPMTGTHDPTNGSTENAQEARSRDRELPISSSTKIAHEDSTTQSELESGTDDHSSGGRSEHSLAEAKDAPNAAAIASKNENPAQSAAAKTAAPPPEGRPVLSSTDSAPANGRETTLIGNQPRLLPDNIFDRVKSEVVLKGVPDQSVQIIGESWMNPIDLATFPVSDPDIDLFLESSSSGTDGPLPALRKEQQAHHWLIYVRDTPLAELGFEKSPSRLTFRWQKTAQVASKQQVDSVRFAVLQLAAKTESGKSQQRQISFFEAERIPKPLRLDPKTGRQRQAVNRNAPADQPLVLRFQLTGLEKLIEKSQQAGDVTEKPGEKSVRFGPDRSIELRLRLQRDRENRPLVNIDLMAISNSEKPTELVSTVKKEVNRRAAFAIDAIIDHVKSTPGFNAAWQTHRVPMTGQQQRDGQVILIFTEADEKNYLRSLKKKRVNELEIQEREFRKNARTASFPELDKHVASFPYLEQWSEIAQQVCAKAEIHVRVTRQIAHAHDAARGTVEADVFVAGEPPSLN